MRPKFSCFKLLALLCAGLLPCSLQADDFERGMQASRQGNYGQALKFWTPLAEQGDKFAQFSLATLYHEGKGVSKDPDKATRWFRKAAEQGLAPAQFNLGNAYRFGRGVTKDNVLAVEWWRKAAIQNMAAAQFNLGTAYLHGRGLDKNAEEAVKWYRRAAANGHPAAQQQLETLLKKMAAKSQQKPSADIAKSKTRQPEKYTIQLMAGSYIDAVNNFITKHGLQGQTITCRTTRNGSPHFLLFYGQYAKYSAAKNALKILPTPLRRNSPWVRTNKSLKQLDCSEN